MEERKLGEQEERITAFLLLVSVGLLIFKAAGYDIEWGVVSAPVWGRIVFLVVREALGLGPVGGTER